MCWAGGGGRAAAWGEDEEEEAWRKRVVGLRAGGGCKGGCWELCRVALFSCCLVLGPQPRGKP